MPTRSETAFPLAFRALATTECLRLRRVATLDDEVAALAA